MVRDTALINTQYYKVRIKDKVEVIQEKEWRRLRHLGVVTIEKGLIGSPLTTVTNFTVYWVGFSKFSLEISDYFFVWRCRSNILRK